MPYQTLSRRKKKQGCPWILLTVVEDVDTTVSETSLAIQIPDSAEHGSPEYLLLHIATRELAYCELSQICRLQCKDVAETEVAFALQMHKSES